MKLFDKIRLGAPRLNKFDLSHERKFSLKMGELIPVYVQDVVPGDKFRVSSEVFMRFAPMLAPVMHRINVFVHYFFVPNRLVWNEWEDFITGGPEGTLSPVHPFVRYKEATKGNFVFGQLADYMGFPCRDLPVAVLNEVDVNALPFRAYQLIWNEYFRDQNLQDPIDFDKGSGEDTTTNAIMAIRNRCWEKDYLTSALPWAQRGGEVLMPFEADVNYRETTRVTNSDGTGPTPGDINAGVPSGVWSDLRDSAGNDIVVDNIESISNGSTTINELRRSVRLQEWLEKNARGGARYIEQILSHFGVVSSDARLQRPEYLGGGKSPVVISEVLSTVNEPSDDLPQGNMAGHGISIGRTNEFKKRFEEHGYVIGLMSVLPRTAYQDGIPRHLSRADKFDYYWPEFANIGEQAVLNKEVYFDASTSWPEPFNGTFGYQSRYAEYKYGMSTVHGEFRNSLNYWHLGRLFAGQPSLNENFVAVQPGDQDRIFAAMTESGENLWCQLYNKVDALRPMPYFGTPTL